MMTDEARWHHDSIGRIRAARDVNHAAEEYVARRQSTPTPLKATISIFKRGMHGVYQHCSEKHLHRYLAEFDFRYSNRVRLGVDDEPAPTAPLQGIIGKRLTYRTANDSAALWENPA